MYGFIVLRTESSKVLQVNGMVSQRQTFVSASLEMTSIQVLTMVKLLSGKTKKSKAGKKIVTKAQFTRSVPRNLAQA